MKLPTNKNAKTVLSLAFCRACLLLGASTFASYASLSEESFSLSSGVQTVTPAWQKSLADFGHVLGQRLAGVWQEAVGLVDGRSAWSSLLSSSASPTVSTTGALDADALLPTSVQIKNFFSDIAGDPHASYINLLAKERIVAWTQWKFYPDNYLRLYDLIKMTVDLYRDKVGYGVTGEQWLSVKWAFSGDNSLPSRYVATALQLWFLAHIQPLDFQKFASSQDFVQILANVSYEFTGLVQMLNIGTEDALTRADVAELLVKARGVTTDGIIPFQSWYQVPFQDIYDSPYQSAIMTLAQLWIVSTDTASFYPTNDLHRYDFTIMLVNSLLYRDHKTLSASYVSGFTSPFVDVSQSSYSPFVYYAYDNHLIDFLMVNKRGQDYFMPDAPITKYEVFTILSKATWKTFSYNVQQADQEYMSRWEFAQLLIHIFGFTTPQTAVPTVSIQGTGSDDSALSILLKLKDLLAKI